MYRVLVIAFTYPPVNAISGLRVAKFVKYLPDHGFEPLVVTPEPDPTHPAGLPDELRVGQVVRTGFLNLNYWIERRPGRRPGAARAAAYATPGAGGAATDLRRRVYRAGFAAKRVWERVVCFPDAAIGWYPYAVAAARRLIASQPVDLIFSTAGPPTAHLVAARLKKLAGRPWVADFRDLWTTDPYASDPRGGLLRRLEEGLERRVMASADAAITISAPYADILARQLDRPVHVIENGFDAEEVQFDIPLLEPFVLTYTGEFDGSDRRDPRPVFEAVATLARQGKVRPEDLRLRFFGRSSHLAPAWARPYGIEGFVESFDRVAYRESLARQKESAALLLLSWDDPRARGVYTGKIFEYLASGRPVLGLGPRDGVIAELLRQTGGGVVENDPLRIADLLLDWQQRHRRRELAGADPAAVRPYTRAEGTRRLAEVFRGVLARAGR